MKTTLTLLVLLLSIASTSAQWRELGPYHGDVISTVTYNGAVYNATSVGYVYSTTDGGAKLTRQAKGLGTLHDGTTSQLFVNDNTLWLEKQMTKEK